MPFCHASPAARVLVAAIIGKWAYVGTNASVKLTGKSYVPASLLAGSFPRALAV